MSGGGSWTGGASWLADLGPGDRVEVLRRLSAADKIDGTPLPSGRVVTDSEWMFAREASRQIESNLQNAARAEAAFQRGYRRDTDGSQETAAPPRIRLAVQQLRDEMIKYERSPRSVLPRNPLDQRWQLVDPDAPPRPTPPPSRPDRNALLYGVIAVVVAASTAVSLIGGTDIAGAVTVLIIPVAAMLLLLLNARKTDRRDQEQRQHDDAERAWERAHLVRRTEPVARLDDAVSQRKTLYQRRCAEEWIGDDWRAVIDRRMWTLARRLQGAAADAAAVAEADSLDGDHPELRAAAEVKRAELGDLDRAVQEFSEELRQLDGQAVELDRALATADKQKADRAKAAELTAHLTGATAADLDQHIAAARAELADPTSGDLSILAAGLRAVQQHLRD